MRRKDRQRLGVTSRLGSVIQLYGLLRECLLFFFI